MSDRAFARILDLSAAILALPLFALGIVCLVVLNPILNPGPVFFRQTRVGRWGVPFTVVKFRTLDTKGEARWFGRLLRVIRFDELPQILNILTGDMAFVGPRPLTLQEVHVFGAQIAGFSRRHTVRPGITGLAQLRQGHTRGVSAARRKLAWDRLYLRRRSLGFDLILIGHTLALPFKAQIGLPNAALTMDRRRTVQ